MGDGITGLIRNILFKRRVKHWSGNIAMFTLCSLISYFLGFGLIGILAAFIASIVEHFEKIGEYYIDNITVPVSSFIVLYFGKILI